jgi:SAM-dependent methyltransferase
VLFKHNKKTKYSPVKNNSSEWEKRSINYGISLQSVLFKGMPDPANEHFHSTHVNFILDCLAEQKDKIKILDVGCGYGRLSLPIIKKLPHVEILGMDISPNYVSLYKKNTGREAIVGALESLPPEIGTFDCIIVATVLMYLPETSLREVFSSLLVHLNSNGKIILIEPEKSGLIFQTIFGLARLRQKVVNNENINTGGRCFTSAQIHNLVRDAGGRIIKERRIPATTFFFFFIYVLAKILPANWTKIFFRWLTAADGLLKKTRLPTLWLFSLIEKG